MGVDTVAMIAADGSAVPFTLAAAGDDAGSDYWISPTSLLAPGVYSITARGNGYTASASVEVSGAVDSDPPTVTGLSVTGLVRSNYCSRAVGAIIRSDLTSANAAADLVVEVELLRGGVQFARLFPSRLLVGTTDAPGCFGDSYVAGLTPGEHLTARVRFWDMAGNATPFASFDFDAAESPAFSEPCPAGCLNVAATPSGHGTPFSVVFVLALVAVRAARRRRSVDS